MYLSTELLALTVNLTNLLNNDIFNIIKQQKEIYDEIEKAETNFYINLFKSLTIPWQDIIKLQYYLSKNVNVSWEDTNNMEFMEMYELFKIWQEDVKEENEKRKNEEQQQGNPNKSANNMFSQANSMMKNAGNSFKMPKLK